MIRLKIENFWNEFDCNDDFFVDIIKSALNAKIVDSNPDIILYSVFGWRNDNEKPACWDVNVPRICWVGEAISERKINQILDQGDYLLYSKRINHPRYLRLTIPESYNWYGYNPSTLLSQSPTQKTKFCAFIYHSIVRPRENLCNQLMRYKKVDCLSRSLKNADSSILTKRYVGPSGTGMGETNINVLRPYKFNLAIENRPIEGYMTEKIWWAFLARTINLYWGDPTVHESFNKGSFLCRDDFVSEKQFIDAIIELDNDDVSYNKMINTHPIKDDNLINENYLINFIKSIKI